MVHPKHQRCSELDTLDNNNFFVRTIKNVIVICGVFLLALLIGFSFQELLAEDGTQFCKNHGLKNSCLYNEPMPPVQTKV